MTADQGVAFLEALGAKKIRVKGNGWIESACPLAKWRHAKHVDHNPSFGLSITPGGRSRYYCFSCQSGSAEELLQAIELYTHGDLTGYDVKTCRNLLDDECMVLPLPEYSEHASSPGVMFQPWPEYWLDSFQKAEWVTEAAVYLVTRTVSLDQVQQFDLRYDLKRRMIVAPYRDVFGRLAGARGRSIFPDVIGPKKHFDYSYQGSNNARFCWFHEGVLHLSGPVVVVEGQFDCMRVAKVFPKVVANLTAKPWWEKMKKLGDCPFMIQIPDRDATGQQSTVEYQKYCAQLGIGYKMLWLDEGVKDPDECHPEYLRTRIEALL